MPEPTPHTAPLEAARTRRDNLEGAAYAMTAAVGFTVVSVLVKKLGNSEIGVFQTVAVRSVIGLFLLAPLFFRAGLVPWRTQHLKIHLTRAVLGGTAVLTGYYAFMKLPLAEVTAISFTVPLFVTVAAVLFLGEIVRWRRWTATALGFAGVLVVARPSKEASRQQHCWRLLWRSASRSRSCCSSDSRPGKASSPCCFSFLSLPG